jgi:membrane associated rhomboid family serine protease
MRVFNKISFLGRFSLTNKLIFLNVLFFVLSVFIIALWGDSFFIKYFAITPNLILSGQSLWTFLTSIFVHAGFFHLFANMFSLFFLGNFLERIIGSKRLIWLYLFAGLLGGIFYVSSSFIFGGLDIPAVGASGAIFGILGVLAVLVPYSKIYLIVGPLILLFLEVVLQGFLPVLIMNAVSIVINILFFVMLFSLFSFNSSLRKIALPLELRMWVLPFVAIIPLVLIGLVIHLPIGNSAHFGGLVMGLIYGFYLRKKFPNKTRMIARRFS